jgi:hypothetical protein
MPKSEWFKVKDKLPPDSRDVIFYDSSFASPIMAYYARDIIIITVYLLRLKMQSGAISPKYQRNLRMIMCQCCNKPCGLINSDYCEWCANTIINVMKTCEPLKGDVLVKEAIEFVKKCMKPFIKQVNNESS